MTDARISDCMQMFLLPETLVQWRVFSTLQPLNTHQALRDVMYGNSDLRVSLESSGIPSSHQVTYYVGYNVKAVHYVVVRKSCTRVIGEI